MEEHSLLGHGLSGEVYYPSIDCDELKSSYDYVSKIGLLETMQKEKEAYDKLPLVLDGKLYFKFAKICAINNTNRANLVIKYIPGNTLEEYLNNFKKYNHNGEIISEEVFKKLLLSWLGLVNNIKELIRLNYVHSDIQASNIMYDSIKNHMYLVDFGHFQSIENENDKRSELLTLYRFILLEILLIGYQNERIRNSIESLKPGLLTLNASSSNVSVFKNGPSDNKFYKIVPYKWPLPPVYEKIEDLLNEVIEFIHQLIEKIDSLNSIGGKNKKYRKTKRRKQSRKKTSRNRK